MGMSRDDAAVLAARTGAPAGVTPGSFRALQAEALAARGGGNAAPGREAQGHAAKASGKRSEDAVVAGARLDPGIATVEKRHEAWRMVRRLSDDGKPLRAECVPVDPVGADYHVRGHGWVAEVECKGTGEPTLSLTPLGKPLIRPAQRRCLDDAHAKGHGAAVLARVGEAWWVVHWPAWLELEARARARTVRGHPRLSPDDLGARGVQVGMDRGLPRWLPALCAALGVGR